MASSNRHWPSMFKSKPCNTTHHQWENDLNHSLMSPTASHPTPYTPGHGFEERTPEPKPRWNPKPEQIRILEAIFNSGMVNPPRDEIRKIRAQLQEYGQVGDANVFYWFQNRKSRSKHKQRQLQNAKTQPQQTPLPPPSSTNIVTAFATVPSSSSSSSNKSSPNNSSDKSLSVCRSTMIDLLNSPTASVNQPFFQSPNEFMSEPFFFPVQQNTVGSSSPPLTQGFCFPDVTGVADQSVENCSSFLFSELMLMSQCPSKKYDGEKVKFHQQFTYAAAATSTNPPPVVPPSLCDPSFNNQILQGLGVPGPTKSTVFINDVCFEMGVGPFNVREAFGDDAVLIQSSGQPVVMNEWGVTLQPLQHGAFYYLVRPFTPPTHDKTIDLI